MSYALWVLGPELIWKRVHMAHQRCWVENEAQRWKGYLIDIVEMK